jgi:hypothetical protein
MTAVRGRAEMGLMPTIPRCVVTGHDAGGEVVLVLDDSETVLRAGDVVVQRGTSHRWENRSGATARVAFILIDGAFA